MRIFLWVLPAVRAQTVRCILILHSQNCLSPWNFNCSLNCSVLRQDTSHLLSSLVQCTALHFEVSLRQLSGKSDWGGEHLIRICADYSYVFVCSVASQRHGNKCSPRDTPGSVGSTYDHPYPTLLTRRNGSNYSHSSPDGEHSSWWWITEPFRRNRHQNYFEVRFR